MANFFRSLVLSLQILSPLSKGLFHKAIMESGVAIIPYLRASAKERNNDVSILYTALTLLNQRRRCILLTNYGQRITATPTAVQREMCQELNAVRLVQSYVCAFMLVSFLLLLLVLEPHLVYLGLTPDSVFKVTPRGAHGTICGAED